MPLFCSKPFQWLDISLYPDRGAAYLCCPTWLPRSIGNAMEKPISELWNGPVAEEIRRSIHDGSFRFCRRRCPFLLNRAGPVSEVDAITDPELRTIATERATLRAKGPTVLNVAFDRSCNLSCPSCRQERLVEREAAGEIERLIAAMEDSLLAGASLLYITGSGDPFGSPYLFRWLRRLEVARFPNLKGIHLHTNALLWTKERWQKLPLGVRGLVKSCEISIDAATAPKYQVLRRGGSFDTLLGNSTFLRELRLAGPLEYTKIHMVVQAANYEEMPAFVSLARHFAADRIYFSQIENWGTFSRAEYQDVAVHRANHPQHGRLLEVLRSPELRDPRVDLGNLASLVELPPSSRPSPHHPIERWVG